MPKTPIPVPKRAGALGLRYREIAPVDLPFLQKVYASTRREEMAMTGWPVAQQQAFLSMQFDAQHSHYQAHYPDAVWLVVEHGIIPVGRLYLEDWTRELRIIDIALLSEFRGRGWGAAMLQDLMEVTGATGRAVSIHVEKTNPAMKLYQSLGFKVIEDKGVYDLMSWTPPA